MYQCVVILLVLSVMYICTLICWFYCLVYELKGTKSHIVSDDVTMVKTNII